MIQIVLSGEKKMQLFHRKIKQKTEEREREGGKRKEKKKEKKSGLCGRKATLKSHSSGAV